jgi:hypothetical protein
MRKVQRLRQGGGVATIERSQMPVEHAHRRGDNVRIVQGM